jgi:hypothetical protein
MLRPSMCVILLPYSGQAHEHYLQIVEVAKMYNMYINVVSVHLSAIKTIKYFAEEFLTMYDLKLLW